VAVAAGVEESVAANTAEVELRPTAPSPRAAAPALSNVRRDATAALNCSIVG